MFILREIVLVKRAGPGDPILELILKWRLGWLFLFEYNSYCGGKILI